MKRFLLFLLFIGCIVMVQAEAISFKTTKLCNDVATPINTTVEQYFQIIATASALEAPMSIYLTGANADQFALSTETIEAGTSTTKIYVAFRPTKIGELKAFVNFESPTDSLNQGFSIKAMAYDPANPPTITIEHANVTNFTANAGKQQQQSFVVTTKNLLDWSGTIIIKEQSTPGTFILSSTTLQKNATQTFTLTFSPKQKGTFTATIEASALLAESVSFQVTGTCANDVDPEQKEGDELIIDESDPLALYMCTFDETPRNGALQNYNGWTNVATKGTRAWWGYEFDGDACAKVTPYVYGAANESECQMILISPALKANTEVPHLGFDIRGDFLMEGQVGIFEVLYIEVEGSELYLEPIQMALPHTEEEAGMWIPYVMDLMGQNIAPVFHIGFSFTGLRGPHSETYYVDNFTWGYPLNIPSSVETTTTPSVQTRKLLRDGQVIILRDNKAYNVLGIEL